jgi:hypothetical protein
VASFQTKFEERFSELHLKLAHPIGGMENGFERPGGTESGFGDANLSEVDLEESIYVAKEKTKQYVGVFPGTIFIFWNFFGIFIYFFLFLEFFFFFKLEKVVFLMQV